MKLAALLLLAAGSLAGQTPRAPEYQLKAVFLFNFARYVDWPAGTFADSTAPFVIGVLGRDPFGQYLDETIRGESLRGHALEVRRFRTAETAAVSHILFISSSEEGRLGTMLELLRARPILTVGDYQGFAQQGGIIRFVSEDGKIRIRVNTDAATAANLTISSKLLRAADIVTPGRP